MMSSPVELSPDIVLFHILPRLPVHSLRRFRFVSKQWYSFITTPVFAHMQLHHQHQYQNQIPNQHKLLLLSKHETNFRIMDIDSNKGTFTFGNFHLPFNVVDYKLSVLKSLHGMVLCVRIIKKWSWDYTNNFDLILWNPVTGDYKTLSKPGFDHKEYYSLNGDPFGLYYSSCDNDYKVLRITPWHDLNPNVYIYSLKSDSWRKLKVESSPDFQISYYDWFWSPTALLNEKLYFSVDDDRRNNDVVLHSIIRFDTKTEKFTRVATPFPGTAAVYWLFAEYNNCIYLSVSTAHLGSELWRMDGELYWTKVVSLLPTWLNELPPPWDLEPLHVTRNENLLLMFRRSDYSLYQLDVKKQTREILCALPKKTTIVEYIETIVSPNQYTN